jgi:magnesium chelatase subunit H
MPKLTTAAEASVPMRVVLVTMDSHLVSAADRAQTQLAKDMPRLRLNVHAAADWADDAAALARCHSDIAQADIVIVTMLFMEDHFRPVLDALRARRDHCDAMVCAMSAGEVMKLTRMGKFNMSGTTSGPMALLKKLRGNAGKAKADDGKPTANNGASQMKMLRRIPKLLRFIPGTAQDVRAYFLTLQYWLAGSQDNIGNLVRLLVERYADGERRSLRAYAKPQTPVEYPEVGVYHPQMAGLLSDDANKLPLRKNVSLAATQGVLQDTRGASVGLLLMRSYLLAGNASHYDGVIQALEARGLRVVPAFATGLDARPAIERFFLKDGRAVVDAVVSLTGFSLVGGPAYNDSQAAQDILAKLDVPYLSVTPVEFQTLAQWEGNDRGLLPVESTMMVSIPELDGATGAMVFGGRAPAVGGSATDTMLTNGSDTPPQDMQAHAERCNALAARVAKLVALRRSDRAQRKVAVVLFNFPPNAGNTGTAAFLSVFESLHNTLLEMKRGGYTVDVPATVDELRGRIVCGNAERYGALANVHTRISVNDHVKREVHLAEIEAQWGPAPGRQQSDGASIHVLGERFGNVFVGVQPGFGYEGDPMRLLFEKGFAPTHAFSAFYRWVREDFGAHAVLHFGTHGALEFMPGKQACLSSTCWPDRLIGDLPNIYLYASNNPSEGTIAKRRAAATLISYMTPPVAQAGLYRGLVDLKSSLERWRGLPPGERSERDALAPFIQTQAVALDLVAAEPVWKHDAEVSIVALQARVMELEVALIPHGLHVVGRPLAPAERLQMLSSMGEATLGQAPSPVALQALIDGRSVDQAAAAANLTGNDSAVEGLNKLAAMDQLLMQNGELDGLMHALDGGFVRPAPGGDLLRTPAVLPTGRNLHGFDPFRIPSSFAVQDGARQAQRLIDRHVADGHAFPESIALVLWGTDNLKSEGGPIGQALALMGAEPRFDSYGRLAGAQLKPLAQLGRPRIDVMITLSGIFRDLLPLQVKLLAEAAFMAASADEPAEQNFVRKHALAFQAEHGGDMETASLRVFGNAEGAYGANVNHLVDSSRWEEEDELAETFTRRKGFAYGRSGRPVRNAELLKSVLSGVQLAYQNLDSVELGVTSIDTYFDTLGGISRAVQRAKTEVSGAAAVAAPVYIGDQTQGDIGGGTVRTLAEQVALETRTRMLNPKFFEAMLAHGYEGVRHLEAHVTNTFAWSATTGQVAPWVYEQLAQTFVLDPAMRERLAQLNPNASAKFTNRLLEAHQRQYWSPDDATLAALRQAGEELEDRLEGIYNDPAPNLSLNKAAA